MRSLEFRPAWEIALEAFLVSTGVVAVAEMGDKTQVLSLLLAARFRRPWPIIVGILVATTINHALAGALGQWLTNLVSPDVLRWTLGGSFIAMAAWILVPDKTGDQHESAERYGVLGTTVITFFLAEIGDKTQIATVALAAKFTALWVVVAGTTLGMMVANVPAVFLGERLAKRIPLKLARTVAAAIFAVVGAASLLSGDASAATSVERSRTASGFAASSGETL